MKLTPLLTTHAVVQRHQTIPVWGWTDHPRTRVRASLGAARAEGISGDDARFLLRLPALPAGGPHTLVVESLDGGERIEVSDILVGEVWLASGQSNMQWTMAASGYAAEIAAVTGVDARRRRGISPFATGRSIMFMLGHWRKTPNEEQRSR